MQKIHFASAALVLVSSIAAQTTTTLPLGYETVDGGSYSNRLFGYADGRTQICYGDLQTRKQTLVVNRMSFRRESTNGTTNVGRSWTNVQVQVGQHDFKVHTDTWTENLLKPTTVFSAAFKLPDTNGFPSTTPAPWGQFATSGTAVDFQFPFNTPYVHPAGAGFTAQFDFTGGMLSNGGTWGSAFNGYYMDGIDDANCTATAPVYIYGRNAACQVQSAYDPYSATWLKTNHLPGGGANYLWQWYDYYMPPNATVITAITFARLATPINFNNSCYQLYVDLTKPYLLFPHVVDNDGHWFDTFRQVPFVAAWAGTDVFTQAAFDHNNKFELSTMISAAVQPLTTGTVKSFSFRLYYADKTRDVGYGPYNTLLPVMYLH